MANFKLDVDGDGIALVTWDMPGKSMNVIDVSVMEELEAVVEKVSSDAAIKGAVVTSGKDTFGGGADLTMLEKQRSDYETTFKSKGEEAAIAMVFERSRRLSQIYRKLETSGKPWVAALNGTAMGGGFELALACHHRIAADNPKTRLGLPEIKVGLFPGAGGTQRIARMLPPADALQFLLKGDQLRLDRAKAMKLVDYCRAGGGSRERGQDLDQDLAEIEAAVGHGRLPAARRPGVVEDGHDDVPGRERALSQGDAGQLSGRARDHELRLRGAAGAVRHRAAHRVALLRESRALAGGGRDDPLAVRLDAGAEQGRAAARGRRLPRR